MSDLDRANAFYLTMLAAARREGAEAAMKQFHELEFVSLNELKEAERRGAEEMRERAAQEADRASELMTDSDIQFGSISGVAADLAKDLADAIRALPLTPEADEPEGGRGSAG